jgi:HPt (histidine-containing phosphotransfer) domain-containing protein
MAEKKFNVTKLNGIVGGDKNQMSELKSLFLSVNKQNLADLNLAYKDGQLIKVKEIAHKMKTSIDLWDIFELKQDIRKIERLAQEGSNPKMLDQLIQKLNEVLTTVFAQMK